MASSTFTLICQKEEEETKLFHGPKVADVFFAVSVGFVA